MAEFDTTDVRRYYDRNTAHFLAYGQGGGFGALHRPVWGPRTHSTDEAFRYVEDRLLDLIRTLRDRSDPVQVIDLGCGVGGSLCYLAGRAPVHGTGLTLSPVQVRHASRRIRDAALTDRVTCREADFCEPPDDLAPADLVYAIESFVHGPDPVRFFAACARLTRPDGRLVICDDFRRPAAGPAATRATERFRRGWHLNTLIDAGELLALADRAGFDPVSVDDLTPHLALDRPRDRLIAAFAALCGWLPLHGTRAGHLIGGAALRTCLANGWIGYDLAVFRRRADHDARAARHGPLPRRTART